jgi:hypothetical protein
MATGEPDRDNRWARLRPMPEAAPVINTGLPVMSLRFLAIYTPYPGGCAVRIPPAGIIHGRTLPAPAR